MHVLVTCKFEETLAKNEGGIGRTKSFLLSVNRSFRVLWKHRVLSRSHLKPNAALKSLTHIKLHIFFNINGQLASEMYTFGLTDERTHADDGLLVYYKFTLTFGSNELTRCRASDNADSPTMNNFKNS